MISASCPSCGAPISFAHAASATVVCGHCTSTVVREAGSLRNLGKVSAFERDLSPIQVGASGTWKERGFTVVGVLRKGRDRARWNEWALVFADGGTGWLGEHNGNLVLFGGRAVEQDVPSPADLAPGRFVEVGEAVLGVVEVGEAQIVAAEGELPDPVDPQERSLYADLYGADGKSAATIDATIHAAVDATRPGGRGEDGPASTGAPRLYLGRVVTLVELKLTGLRPFAGWSDPALVGFAGPEIQAVRAVACPNCGAPVTLRAPGASPMIVCGSCGSHVALREAAGTIGAEVLEKAEKVTWKPPLPLGKRLTLGGLPWEVIGAMRRSVESYGERYYWVEHVLHNPYRGFRWLVKDETQGFWTMAEVLPIALRLVGNRAIVPFGGAAYKVFQTGRPRVETVLGEFTWEVHRGDMVDSSDYVAPPRMLSREEADGEITWTLGHYLSPDEARAAGLPTLGYQGVAPHQPNPYQSRAVVGTFRVGAGVALVAGVAIFAYGVTVGQRERLFEQTFTTAGGGNETFVSDPFTVPDAPRTTLQVGIRTTLDRDDAVSRVTLLHEPSGTAWYLRTGDGRSGSALLGDAEAGTWRAYVDVYKAPGKEARGASLELRVDRDPLRFFPSILLFLYALVGPALRWVLSTAFEGARWRNAG